MYVAIDRKPESGCEIQNSACGKSGVMLRLKVVKHIESEDLHLVEGPDELPHGTSVLKYLVLPWAQTVEMFVLILTLPWSRQLRL